MHNAGFLFFKKVLASNPHRVQLLISSWNVLITDGAEIVCDYSLGEEKNFPQSERFSSLLVLCFLGLSPGTNRSLDFYTQWCQIAGVCGVIQYIVCKLLKSVIDLLLGLKQKEKIPKVICLSQHSMKECQRPISIRQSKSNWPRTCWVYLLPVLGLLCLNLLTKDRKELVSWKMLLVF